MAQELETKKTDSVFDFLYVDHHRVGLFLSQFSEFGNLTDIVHTKGVTDDALISAGVKGIVGGEAKSGHSSNLQSKYNPLWIQALNFLDEVNARGMVSHDLASAAIGSLVLTKGCLNIVNMLALSRSWDVAAENAREQQKSKSAAGNRKLRRTGQQQHDPEAEGPGLLRLLGSFDQPIMMALDTGKARLWSTLDQTYLVGGSSDLALKHGVQIAGEWHAIGILDCLPGELIADEANIGRICGGADNPFSSSAIGLFRELGLIFGRPADCYGITPIMIMREVGAT